MVAGYIGYEDTHFFLNFRNMSFFPTSFLSSPSPVTFCVCRHPISLCQWFLVIFVSTSFSILTHGTLVVHINMAKRGNIEQRLTSQTQSQHEQNI